VIVARATIPPEARVKMHLTRVEVFWVVQLISVGVKKLTKGVPLALAPSAARCSPRRTSGSLPNLGW
jgi:hypothetical protein